MHYVDEGSGAPIVFVHGERWQSALSDAPVLTFEDCGHFLAEEAPERVLPTLREFMSETAAFRVAGRDRGLNATTDPATLARARSAQHDAPDTRIEAV